MIISNTPIIEPISKSFWPAFGNQGNLSIATIPGLYCDYDLRVGVTLNGSDISAISCQQGNENMIQATAADQPLFIATDSDFNNQPSAEFDGVTETMTSDYASAFEQPNTIFVVGKQAVTGAGQQFFWDGRTSTNRHFFLDNDNPMQMGDNNTDINGANANTNAYIFAGRWALLANFYLDGVLQGSGDTQTGGQSFDGFQLAARNGGAANFANWKFTRLLFYFRGLNNSELNAIGTELAGIYGQSWALI